VPELLLLNEQLHLVVVREERAPQLLLDHLLRHAGHVLLLAVGRCPGGLQGRQQLLARRPGEVAGAANGLLGGCTVGTVGKVRLRFLPRESGHLLPLASCLTIDHLLLQIINLVVRGMKSSKGEIEVPHLRSSNLLVHMDTQSWLVFFLPLKSRKFPTAVRMATLSHLLKLKRRTRKEVVEGERDTRPLDGRTCQRGRWQC
jgi:hypothetical protein